MIEDPEMTEPETSFVFSSEPPALQEVITTRRTIGAFLPRVDGLDEAIVEAVEMARWAPNHRRTEPWNFHKLGPQTIEKVLLLSDETLTASKGADVAASKRRQWAAVPGWLVVSCSIAEDAAIAEEDYAACACAIQNLTLSLWSRGVASKWSTGEITQSREFAAICGLDPEKSRVAGLIWYGYPAKVPSGSRKRTVAEILHELP